MKWLQSQLWSFRGKAVLSNAGNFQTCFFQPLRDVEDADVETEDWLKKSTGEHRLRMNRIAERKLMELDSESTARLKEVRKEVYRGSLMGLVGGSSIGTIGYFAAHHFMPSMQKQKNKSSFIATVLVGASVGSFIGALVYGKNAVQYIGDIFRIGSSPSTYQGQRYQEEDRILGENEDAFRRRQEAIRKATEAKKWQPSISEHRTGSM